MQIFKLNQEGNVFFLNQDESERCTRTLRYEEGREIHCIDGRGNYYRCKIEHASSRKTLLSILDVKENWGEKTEGHIILAASPLRQKDRFEWLIEKSVELGADEIIPIYCRHTITDNIKPDRLPNLITAAAKQCKRSRFPIVHSVTDFEDLAAIVKPDLKLLAYCEAEMPILHYQAAIQKANSVMICIGPEGDFSANEVQWAQENGFELVSFGESRLRTETAGIFALSMLKGLKGY